MVKIKSILEDIAPQVFRVTNIKVGKELVMKHVNERAIKGMDKDIMLRNVSQIKTTEALHRYICNSLLKYEGMSVK
tara:strand:- start:2417 stop:2644 length:228 start_codon:yes stop_codon:yes gene_type:complete